MSPVYDYLCKHCGTAQEAFFKLGDKPDDIPCVCGKEADKVISVGAVIGDEMPAWMRHPEVTGVYKFDKKEGHKVTTRSAFNKYLKDRNIIIESKHREF